MIPYPIDKIILLTAIFFILIPNVYAVTESVTEYGSLQIEHDVYELIQGEQTIIKTWGTIVNSHGESRLNIVIFLPDGLTEGIHALPTSSGYFETFWTLSEESQLGHYRIVMSYESNILGEVSFEVKEKEYSNEELMTAREMLDQIQQSKEFKESVKESKPISKYTSAKFNGVISLPQGSGRPGCDETNECYIPFGVSVYAGEEITWSNDDSAAHTVTSGTPSVGPDGNFHSGLFMAGSTFSVTLDAVGEYPYFCMVHPWMTGTITVVEISENQPKEKIIENYIPEPVLIEVDPIEIIPIEDKYTLYDEGIEKLNQQKYSDALNLFNQALKYDSYDFKIQNIIEKTENKIHLINKCENKNYDSVDAFDFYSECCNLGKDGESITTCRQELVFAKQAYLKELEPEIDPLTQVLQDTNEFLISESNKSMKILRDETSQSTMDVVPYLLIGGLCIGFMIFLKKRNKTEEIGIPDFS